MQRKIFFPNATTCPLRLRGLPLRLWLKCNRLLRLGRPVGAVTLSRWELWDKRWIWGARGDLTPSFYQLPRPWTPWASSPFKEKTYMVEPGIEPGTSCLVVRNSDHQATRLVIFLKLYLLIFLLNTSTCCGTHIWTVVACYEESSLPV